MTLHRMPPAEDGLRITMEQTLEACAISSAVLQGLSDVPGRTFLVLTQRCGAALKDSSAAAALDYSNLAQEMAWEKLHTGNWKDVSLDWRNGYSLACLLAAAASLLLTSLEPGSTSPRSALTCSTALAADPLHPPATQLSTYSPDTTPRGSTAAIRSQEADDQMAALKGLWPEEATLAGALLQLDLAAMMGGPAFRPHVDDCIQAVQSMLHGCTPAPSQALQPKQQACHHPCAKPSPPDPASQPELQADGHSAAISQLLTRPDDLPLQPRFDEQQHTSTANLTATHPSQSPAVLAAQPGAGTLQGNGSLRSMRLHGSGSSHMDSNDGLTTVDPAAMLSKAAQPHGTPVWEAVQPDADSAPPTSTSGACPLQADSIAHGLADAARKRRRVSMPASPNRDLLARQQEAGSGAAMSGLDNWPRSSQEVPLPQGSLSGSVRQGLPIFHLPSFERFFTGCMCCSESGQPAVLTGAMEGWPAMTRWHSPAYLAGLAGLRTIPVELGRHYLADGWGQRLMLFSDFLRLHMLPAASDAASQVGYLAQHPLFEQISELKADIAVPEYCALGNGELQSINAWLGPAGTVTPLHHDPHHNLLAQVVGSKYVRLYPPNASAQMCPHMEGMTTNASRLDLDVEAPQVAGGGAPEPFWDCVLQPGHMLYIPPGWWHYVKAASISISVSFWWQ